MKVKKVKEMDWKGQAILVVSDETPPRYFVVSTCVPWDTGRMETLVFPADETGEVSNWSGLCGGPGRTRAEAIKELESNEEVDTLSRYVEAMEGVGGALMGAFDMIVRDVKGDETASEPFPEDCEWEGNEPDVGA